MAEIGTFARTETGYAGKLHSFGLRDKLFIVPAKPSDVKNASDYRLRLDSEDGPEIGGAWKRVGERAGDYIALEIDSPLFPALFRPALFQADDEGRTYRLVWKRPKTREDRS